MIFPQSFDQMIQSLYERADLNAIEMEILARRYGYGPDGMMRLNEIIVWFKSAHPHVTAALVTDKYILKQCRSGLEKLHQAATSLNLLAGDKLMYWCNGTDYERLGRAVTSLVATPPGGRSAPVRQTERIISDLLYSNEDE